MFSIEELREKAERCRRLVASIDDPQTRRGLIELAELYQAEAEALERPEPGSDPPPDSPPESSSES